MITIKQRIIAAIGGAAVIGLAVFLLKEVEVSQPHATIRTDQPQASVANVDSPSEETTRPPLAVSANPQQAPFSLAAKVRDLSSSPNPADSLRAYNILAECKWAKEEERTFNLTRKAERDPVQVKRFESGQFAARIAQACGDLKEPELGQRLALVERAAAAGVPLAAIHLANEGPWGDFDALYTRPQDPQVLEWRRKVSALIHFAAAKGDVAALTSLASQYSTGSGVVGELNPTLALQYAVAQHLVYEAQTGKSLLGRERQVKELTGRLSPEAAGQAHLEGERIASEALGRK